MASGPLSMRDCYHEGRREDEKAKAYCDKAIAKNHPCGMVLNSMWYSKGILCHQDDDEAARWAIRAAASENPSALVWLGALYGDKVVPKRMLEEKDFVAGKP